MRLGHSNSLAAGLLSTLLLIGCGAPLEDEDLSSLSADDSWDAVEQELNSPIYDRARAYAAAHPKRDGASWDQWCGSLMWRFGQLPAASARPSAIAAYRASSIVSTNPATARIGAFHWWDIGQYGHVGADLNGGGTAVFMATRNLAQVWGDAIGINSVGGYTSRTGARYLGWSMDYAGGRIAGGGGAPVGGGGAGPLPKTSTEQDGIPGPIYYRRIQTVGAKDFGYSGPVDGVTGPQTELARVKITARELNSRNLGQTTSSQQDGIPGAIYWTLVQRVGQQSFGYNGPIDGVPGPATRTAEHRIAAYAVNRAF